MGRDENHLLKYLLRELATPGKWAGERIIFGTKVSLRLLIRKSKICFRICLLFRMWKAGNKAGRRERYYLYALFGLWSKETDKNNLIPFIQNEICGHGKTNPERNDSGGH